MKRNIHNWIFIISFTIIMSAGFYALTYTIGPPSGNTNAPGDGNCTSCHTGTLITSGTNYNSINLQANIPSTGYVPDSVYSFTLSQAQSGITKFGFQLTALRASDYTKAGTLIVTNATTTQLLTGTRDYIQHTSNGTSGSGNISWSFNWRAPSSNVGNIIFYGVINASNNSNTSGGDMIIAKNFTYSVSTLLPTAVIGISDSTVCVDDTVFLSGSGANSPTTWTWTMIGGSPASSSTQNPFVVYKSSGTFSVSLITKNSRGSSLVATQKIYVSSKPAVSINPAGPLAICQNDSVKLEAIAGKSLTYLWNTSQTTSIIYVKSAGTYFVTVTNPTTGCSQTSKAVTVNVNSLPIVTLTASTDSICFGDTIRFNAAPAGYLNYEFLEGKTIVQNSKISDYTTANLADKTPVVVVVTDLNNCRDSSNKIITKVIYPIDTPLLTCGTATTSSVEFLWQNDVRAIEYEVSTDNGITWDTASSGPHGNSHLITGLQYYESVVLYLRAKDISPCFLSPVAKLTCSSLPCSGIQFRLEYDSVLCEGDSTSIVLHGLNTSKYAVNFENRGYSKDTIYPVKPAGSDTFTLLLIDSNMLNCPAIELKANIRVSTLPVVTLTSDKTNDAVCQGDPIVFSATAGYKNYQFIRNKVNTVQNSSASTYKPATISDGDMFSVIATNADGCSAPGNDISVTVYKPPVTDFTYTDTSLTFYFTDLTTNASFWKWDFGDSHTDSIKNPVHTYAANGLYNVKLAVTDLNGCIDDTVKSMNAINSIKEKETVRLFNARYIRSQEMIEVSYELTSGGNISVSLLSQSGKLIKTLQPGVHQKGKHILTLDVKDLKKGVYVISLNNGSNLRTKKLLID